MINITSSLSSKFQITVPWEVRESLKIDSKNYEIVWLKLPRKAFMVVARKKLGKNENPFLRLSGILASDKPTHIVDDFIKEKRQEAKRENL